MLCAKFVALVGWVRTVSRAFPWRATPPNFLDSRSPTYQTLAYNSIRTIQQWAISFLSRQYKIFEHLDASCPAPRKPVPTVQHGKPFSALCDATPYRNPNARVWDDGF
jgi:hypothetical protein